MKDKINALTARLKKSVAQPQIAYPVGMVLGSAVIAYVIHQKVMHDYDQLLTLPLGREAFNALVNDETTFVRFWTGKHDHVFHVTLA